MFKLEKNYIKLEAKKYKKEYKEILSNIKKYDKIGVFRHIMPDYDALGTQFGFVTWLKENFPEKDIKVLGDNHVTFTPRGLFPETDKISDEWFNDDFLAIIVDVGDQKRIADPRFLKAKYKIKIDHHPATDNIFDTEITATEKASAAELVANFLLANECRYKISELTARYLYIGIAGDSGRFQYGSTCPQTFEIASKLVEKGINLVRTYELMYEKSVEDLEITKFILNSFKVSPEGVAYYVITDSDLQRLHITTERGKENVNMFSSIKGINIWCSITEDTTEPCFRISLRSRNYVISGVAKEYKGGGHDQASGCQIKDLSELPGFIARLDELIKTGK